MPPSDDLYREIESYLGFLIDHDLDDAYEADPINRTLSENKSSFQRNVAASGQKTSPVSQGGTVTPLRSVNTPHAPAVSDISALLHEAKQRAQAARTIEDLFTAIEDFTAMPVRGEGGRAVVRGRGALTPDLLVIGESPDADEDAAGTAFAGKAGQMMDRALTAAGVFDKTWLGTCAFWRAAGGRPLTANDVTLNAPFVHAVVRILKPKAVLILGSAAVSTVLNVDQPLRALRGRVVHYTHDGANIAAAASYPPAFLLRQPQAKAMLWRDLLALTARL